MRFRLTVTETREYEVDPEGYSCHTVKSMLATDQLAFSEDPDLILDHPDTVRTVKVEEVKPE